MRLALFLFGHHIKSFYSLVLTKLTNERGFCRTSLYSTHVHCCSDITVILLIEGTSIYLRLLKEHVLHLASRSSPFISVGKQLHCLSQWPPSLRRGLAAARFPWLRAWIKVVAWISASCECCVCCQFGVAMTGWSLFQRSPNERGVSECDGETSIMRRSCPTRGRWFMEKKLHSLRTK